jgi:hypothetical protein
MFAICRDPWFTEAKSRPFSGTAQLCAFPCTKSYLADRVAAAQFEISNPVVKHLQVSFVPQ